MVGGLDARGVFKMWVVKLQMSGAPCFFAFCWVHSLFIE